MAKRPPIGNSLDPGEISSLAIEPASRSLGTFVSAPGYGAAQYRELQSSLDRFYSGMSALGNRLKKEEVEKDVSEAQVEMETAEWAKEITGKTKEEAEQTFQDAYERGELKNLNSKAVQTTRLRYAANAEFLRAKSEWTKMLDTGEFEDHRDINTGEYVKGKDPAEEWRKLSEAAAGTYGLSDTAGKVTFAEMSARFKPDMAALLNKASTESRDRRMASDAADTVSGTIAQVYGEFQDEDGPDEKRLAGFRDSIAKVYKDFHDIGYEDWAERADQVVYDVMFSLKAGADDPSDAYNTLMQVYSVKVGKRPLGENPHFRRKMAQLKSDLADEMEYHETKEEEKARRRKVDAATEHKGALALAVEESQARFKNDPQGLLDHLETINDKLRSEAPAEVQGAIALAGRDEMNRIRNDIAQETAELAGERQRLYAEMGQAVDGGTLEEWWNGVKAKRLRGELSMETYLSLEAAYQEASQPIRALERNRTWGGMMSDLTSNKATRYDSLPLSERLDRSDAFNRLQEEIQQRALSMVDKNGNVDSKGLADLRKEFDQRVAEMNVKAETRATDIDRISSDLVRKGARPDESMAALPEDARQRQAAKCRGLLRKHLPSFRSLASFPAVEALLSCYGLPL